MLGVSQIPPPGSEISYERLNSFSPYDSGGVAGAVPLTFREAYYSSGIQNRFGPEISRLRTTFPIESSSNISYLPQEEEYRARVLRNKQSGSSEHRVLHDWPLVEGTLAWQPDQIKESDYVCCLSPTDLLEVDEALRYFKASGLPWNKVTKATFPLLHLGKKLLRARDALYHGLGFEVLRGLNVDKYNPEDQSTIFLGITRYIAEDCGPQDRHGTMMKHIMDNHTVESQNDLPFHADVVCDIIALLVVQCSDHGGTSTVAPAWTVYNELAANQPHVIETLMKPDWPFDTFDRDPPYYYRAPLYVEDGKVIFSFSRRLLAGHPRHGRTFGVPRLSEAQAEAIDAVHFTAQKLQVKIPLKQGDIRFVNNLGLLHGRELYHDADRSSESRRHILRLWLRNQDMQWSLPPALKVAWSRIFDDGERKVRWDSKPVLENGRWHGRLLLTECD